MIAEVAGSLSLAIAVVSAATLTILHLRNKQNEVVDNHDQPWYGGERMNAARDEGNQSPVVSPFEAINRSPCNPHESAVVTQVIDQSVVSPSSIKYGIQWATTVEAVQSEPIDALSFGDRNACIEQTFESNRTGKVAKNDGAKPTESDITSLDSETIRTDLNHNRYNTSHRSSISNLDITIPSNLSSSIDLEQFECVSTTSNLSEFLKTT